MINNWQRRRSEFNHDWFKPKYLNALRAFLARIQAKEQVSMKWLKEFIEIDFPSWGKHSEDAWWLVRQFETEMSPQILFKNFPLINCNEDTKEWLSPLVHELWLARFGVKSLIEKVEDLIYTIDECFKELSSNMQKHNSMNIEQLRKDLPDWQRFANACFEFSQYLSDFPRKIEVL